MPEHMSSLGGCIMNARANQGPANDGGNAGGRLHKRLTWCKGTQEDPGDRNFRPNFVQILQHRIADVLRQGEFRFPSSLAANAQAALLPVYVVNGQPLDVSRAQAKAATEPKDGTIAD